MWSLLGKLIEILFNFIVNRERKEPNTNEVAREVAQVNRESQETIDEARHQVEVRTDADVAAVRNAPSLQEQAAIAAAAVRRANGDVR